MRALRYLAEMCHTIYGYVFNAGNICGSDNSLHRMVVKLFAIHEKGVLPNTISSYPTHRLNSLMGHEDQTVPLL